MDVRHKYHSNSVSYFLLHVQDLKKQLESSFLSEKNLQIAVQERDKEIKEEKQKLKVRYFSF